MENLMQINILGTDYSVSIRSDSPKLQDDCDGYVDTTTKEIVIEDMAIHKKDPNSKKDLAVYQRQVLRHEIVHAFLFESGLDAGCEWALNEELVDWLAIQLPKIMSICKDAHVL